MKFSRIRLKTSQRGFVIVAVLWILVALSSLLEAGRLDNVILAGALSSEHVQLCKVPLHLARNFKAHNLGPALRKTEAADTQKAAA